MQALLKTNKANPFTSVYPACLLLVFVWLFVQPFAGGYDSSVAICFITWVCIGLSIVICSAAVAPTPTKPNHATVIFVVMALVIALRQGPLPISLLGAIITLLLMAVWAFCVGMVSQSKQFINALLGALVIAALINALIGLYQYFGWSTTHPLSFIKPVELGNALGQVNQRNLLAFLCVLGLTVIIHTEEWQQKKRLRWALYAAGMLLTAGAAATASRSGALSLIVLSMMVFFTRQHVSLFTRRMTLGFALLYVGFGFFLPRLSGAASVFARFADAEGACHSRQILWSNAITMIEDAPWFGHGWGSLLSTFYFTSFKERFCAFPDHAHNLFLQLSAEMGIPIAVAVAVYCLWLLVSQRQALKETTARKIGYSLFVLSLIYSQTEYPLWNTDFLAVFGLALGLLFTPHTLLQTPKFNEGVVNHRSVTLVLALIGGLVTLAGTAAHYQYRRISQLDMEVELRDWDLRTDPYSKLQEYWLFSNQLQYARIHNVQVTPDNAEKVLENGLALLLYAPGPTVIIKIIESARIVGNKDLEEFHTQRFKEIYPVRYGKWQDSLSNKKRSSANQGFVKNRV